MAAIALNEEAFTACSSVSHSRLVALETPVFGCGRRSARCQDSRDEARNGKSTNEERDELHGLGRSDDRRKMEENVY